MTRALSVTIQPNVDLVVAKEHGAEEPAGSEKTCRVAGEPNVGLCCRIVPRYRDRLLVDVRAKGVRCFTVCLVSCPEMGSDHRSNPRQRCDAL
jgi:hypothetical protein